MIHKLQTLTQSIFSKNNTSIYSIILISILLFFTWAIVYSLIIFKQFSWIQIISVSISFIFILFLFTKFFTDLFQKKVEINLKNIIYALLLFFLMCLLSSTTPAVVNHYVHTYPLLETELGLGWHKDTVFHVSLIQSILNFGYPSIAQHGTMFNLYHVLSHYMDALIIFIARVEPYDSYGLLFIFKVWLLISSITIFLSTIIKRIHPLLYLFIFVLIAPIFTGSWHVIYSHSLWFTTVLIIFTSLKIFRIFISNTVGNKDLYFIFIIIILITLGKISSGLMSGSLIGLFLFIKYPKDKRIHLLGLVLAIFFIFYIKLFSASYGTSVSASYDFSILTIKYFYTTITNYNHSQNIMINSSLLIFIFIFYFFKNRNTYIMLFSSILSYLLLTVITAVKTDLSSSDIWYFYFGFTYVLNLFTFQLIVHELQNNRLLTGNEKFKKIYITALLIAAIYVSSFYVSSNLSIAPTKIIVEMKSLNTKPFRYMNKKLESKNYLTVKKLLLHKSKNTYFKDLYRPLYTFRESIYNIINENNLSKKQTLLFIPKEIYTNNISKFGGQQWARGMLMYAIVGVPILYGINNNKQKAYTQQDYNKNHLWKKSNEFSFEEVCQNNSLKTIIQLVNFKDLTFNIYKCK